MEDVLDLYAEPEDPRRPRVCLDERPYQLTSEVRPVVSAKPGQVERHDFEYKREGTCNLFIFAQPHSGWRELKVTEHRGILDFAHCLKELADVHFPQAERIRLVLDQLNTHRLDVLYDVFDAPEARRLARKFELHYTPKHGSWLNMAEIELSVLARQCLDRSLPSIEVVRQEVAAWVARRNDAAIPVDWRFTTTDARRKLERLYPS